MLRLSFLPPFKFPNLHTPPVRRIAAVTAAVRPPPPPPPPASAYIHLPFCRKRCHYCDFPIVALGAAIAEPDGHDPRISNYVNLLCREIEATKPYGATLQTVFFGGGTPSLVSPALVSRVLDALRSRFGVEGEAEVSMEVDPGTFDEMSLRGYAAVGVNRVSVGVQAFQESLLSRCGRAHGAKEVMEAIEMVCSSQIENWSMDLISSLPHQTLEMWEESLDMAVRAGPKHISVYDLQVEQGTKFGLWYKPGEYPLPCEDESATFYKRASEVLRGAGYNHYEISSYCRDGYECKHNLAYWQNKSFYGFGLGSASYLAGVRFSRPRRMKEYLAYVEGLETRSQCEETSKKIVDVKDLAMDVVMLSMRTARGLDVKQFQGDFGLSLLLPLCEALRVYVKSGHVVVLDEKGKEVCADEFGLKISDGEDSLQEVSRIRLSDPDGFLLSNELISTAFGGISSS